MTIDDFRETIVQLKPGNVMAGQGAASGMFGTVSSGGSAVADLQRAAIEFVRVYKAEDTTGELNAARRDLTAKIMVAATLDAISEAKADELMESLNELMKERSK